MKEIYTVMSATLGVPPPADEKFVWDYYDKDGKPAKWEGTPKEFYRTVAVDKYSVSSYYYPWRVYTRSRAHYDYVNRVLGFIACGFILSY